MSSAFSRYSAMLEEIGNQEEFRLDTPVNREVIKVLEELKGTEEKKSVEELLLTIEGEVVELISTCISGSVQLVSDNSNNNTMLIIKLLLLLFREFCVEQLSCHFIPANCLPCLLAPPYTMGLVR